MIEVGKFKDLKNIGKYSNKDFNYILYVAPRMFQIAYFTPKNKNKNMSKTYAIFDYKVLQNM